MPPIKKIAVLGHFAFGKKKTNGQTIKTKIITEELRRCYGDADVDCFDTEGGIRFLLRMPFVLLTILRSHHNVVVLPAFKAVYLILPTLTILNSFFHRRLHYVVIGGRLSDLLQRIPPLRLSLKKIDYIYPETHFMSETLRHQHVLNTIVMPNFKHLDIIPPQDVKNFSSPPFPLCTFSRVEPSKGIEDAIKAVRMCNERTKKVLYTLDIYGPVQSEDWFNLLMSNQPQEIRYRGIVPFDKSTAVLTNYFALLFPTFYAGEGFAGTLIDALASGVPVIASDWKSNPEIVEHGRTGYIYPTHNVEHLANILTEIAQNPAILNNMRRNCIQKAYDYEPKNIIKTLTTHLV